MVLTEFAYCLRLRICLLKRFAPGAVQARTKLLVPRFGQARAKRFLFEGVGRAHAKSHAGRVGARSHLVQQLQCRAYNMPRQQDQTSNWIKGVLLFWGERQILASQASGFPVSARRKSRCSRAPNQRLASSDVRRHSVQHWQRRAYTKPRRRD